MSSTALESLIEKYGQSHEMIVRAGAGAGKTTELVSRVLAIAKTQKNKNGVFPKIVVTTFTRKATQELRERLMKKALELQDDDLVEFVQKESCLHISTIHGVLSLYLARFGFCIGLNPSFSFMDNTKEERMIKKIIRSLLANSEFASSLETLLEEQSLSRLLESFSQYIQDKAQGGDIKLADAQQLEIAVKKKDEFWIKRATELRDYVNTNEKSDKWQSYAELLSLTIQKLKSADIKSRQQIYQSFTENKERVAFKKGTDEATKDLKSDLQDDAKSYAFSWSDSAEAMLKHQEVGSAFLKIANEISTRLNENKISSAQMTMSDLESISLTLIQKFPQTAESFSNEWDYWLVDEYQDTSPRQVLLLKALIGVKKSFTVGDPQQSIYLFRGARSEVFKEKEIQVQKSGGVLAQKMENYRSRPELLEFLNKFFTTLGSQFSEMIPMPQTERPEFKKHPAAIFIQSEDEDQAEYMAVLNRVQKLLDQNISAEKICVLSRTNLELDKLSRLASKVNIPVQVHASAKFYLRREVQDALAVLKFLINPYNNVNLIKLLRSPWFRISDTDLVQICHSQDRSFWKNTKESLHAHSVIQRLQLALEESNKKGVSQVWISLLQSSGLLGTSTFVDATRRREANLWKLILQLKSEERSPGFSYLEFADRTEAAMLSLESQSDSDATPVEEPQRVNFMTIHASKGLQFDHVIIPFMGKINLKKQSAFYIYDEEAQTFSISLVDPEDGTLAVTAFADQVLEKNKEREFQEYDRLLYVAMTRAKVDVTLIWSKVRKNSWADRMWKSETGEHFTQMIRNEKTQDYIFSKKELTGESQNSAKERLELEIEKQSPSVVSVTSLLNFETHHQRIGSTLSSDRLGARAEKAQAGVNMHRLFESLKYRDLNEVEKLAGLSREVRFLKSWNQGQILNWVQQGEVEWGFCLEYKEKWIQGQIDLWSVADNKLWVVDYKTGSESFKEMAIEQLNIYAWAIKKMKKVPNSMETNLVVIYPHIEKVHIEKAKDHVF